MAYIFVRTKSQLGGKGQDRLQKQLTKEKDFAKIRASKREEEIAPRRALQAVFDQKSNPAMSGLLMSREQSLMGSAKWKERYVVLDPKLGNLAYWEIKTAMSRRQLEAMAESSAPLQEYPLEDLISVETNEYHSTIMLSFCKQGNRKQIGKAVTFQADSEEDFDRWVEILSCYGMKETARPAAAQAA